jgi:vacuolar-type H+-ATPase subunit D/Vma8
MVFQTEADVLLGLLLVLLEQQNRETVVDCKIVKKNKSKTG